jgi:hypothetical protein
MKLRVIILSFFLINVTALSAAEPTYTIDQWGITSQRAASLYLPTPANTKYDYQRDPQYNNQIMKHILTINPAFAAKIIILRSVEQPTPTCS